MQKEEIKILFEQDKTALEDNQIPQDLLKGFDDYILSLSDYISEESYSIYKKFVQMKQEAPESMKKNLFATLLNYIGEKFTQKCYAEALFLYRFLAVKSVLLADTFSKIGEALIKSGNTNLSLKFIKLYEKKETNKPLKFLTLANFYNLELKDYKTAIRYYENYLKIDETKPVIYTILASLYAKLYGDLSLKDQIHYFTKAYNLRPSDRLSIKGLAFCYEKLGDNDRAKSFYEKLLTDCNPTSTDFYNYGAFLISCGDFLEGHKYFTYRFLTDDKNLEYPLLFDIERKWDFKQDISDKTLLVHYEQGFGDTFMYCRFVPQLKNLAKKVVFVVQENLLDLIKSSKIISDGIEVVSSTGEVNYDVHMALLDAPCALKITTDTIPFKKGYIEVEDDKISAYAQKYLKKSSNLKVAIAYHGDKNANYNGRDIEFGRFKTLLNMENVDFYSLQCDFEEEENIISLGSTFNDFTDTACAIKNMDIVISTDNVILNLAGALGVKTFAMFNKHTNFRWYKTTGSNVGWYDSVIPFQVEENNCWSDVFSSIVNELSKYTALTANN